MVRGRPIARLEISVGKVGPSGDANCAEGDRCARNQSPGQIDPSVELSESVDDNESCAKCESPIQKRGSNRRLNVDRAQRVVITEETPLEASRPFGGEAVRRPEANACTDLRCY